MTAEPGQPPGGAETAVRVRCQISMSWRSSVAPAISWPSSPAMSGRSPHGAVRRSASGIGLSVGDYRAERRTAVPTVRW